MTWNQTEIVQDGATVRGGYQVEDAKLFFAEIVRREEEIKALKDELKAALDAFATCNNMTTKGIKRGLKDYKLHLKSEAQFQVESHDADVLFEKLVAE